MIPPPTYADVFRKRSVFFAYLMSNIYAARIEPYWATLGACCSNYHVLYRPRMPLQLNQLNLKGSSGDLSGSTFLDFTLGSPPSATTQCSEHDTKY